MKKNQFLQGFNQAWIGYAYSSYLVDQWDEKEVLRTFELAKKSGAKILRFWLFEGTNPGGFIWQGDRPSGLKPEYLIHLRRLIEIAHQFHIELNLTLFDGNISTWKASAFPSLIHKNWWYNLLNEKYNVGIDFRVKILSPLFSLLGEPIAKKTVTHIDLANEINAMAFPIWTNGIRFNEGWDTANAFICRYHQYIKSDQ